MLNDEELQRYFSDHSVPKVAQEYIRKARAAQPEEGRGGRSHKSRFISFFSAKMGHTVRANSATAEGAFILQCENSEECIEYFDQPPRIGVTWTFSNGRTRTDTHIPDFLVLLKDGPALVQCKTTDEVNSLVLARPVDWIRRDGKAIFVAAQNGCDKYGLRHLVFESTDVTTFETANIELMLRARDSADLVSSSILNAVKKALSQHSCITLYKLAQAAHLTDYTPLIQLIERQVLYARIRKDLLTEPHAAWVSSSAAVLESLTLPSGDELLGGTSPTVTADELPGGKRILRGLKNLETFKNIQAPDRTLREHKKKIRIANSSGIAALIAVTPKWDRCGFYGPKLVPEVLEFFEEYFKLYKSSIPKRRAIAYREYRAHAERHHPLHRPMGTKAFNRRLDERREEIARAEGGIRTELAAAPSSEVEVRAARPLRAFQRAHIDHHETDIYVVVARSGKRNFVRRLWLSVMLDSATNMLLEYWLGFRNPSRRTCAVLLRRCIRRHGRLPERIVTDNGAEFESVYYSELLALLRVHKEDRPNANPKYGREAEGFFDLYIKTYVGSRPGRLRNIYDSRKISRSHSSENTASLSASEVIEDFEGFMEWHNNLNTGPNESFPPAELCAASLAHFSCSGIQMKLDERLIIASAVESNDYSVNPQRGIHTRIGWFVNGKLQALAGRRKQKIPIREEPEDPYRIYAQLDGHWITCRHSKDVEFLGKAGHQQLGEALSLLDGAEEHRAAKDHANMEFTRRQLAVDEERIAKEAVATQKESTKSGRNSPDIDSNAFAQARNQKVRQLNLTFVEERQ